MSFLKKKVNGANGHSRSGSSSSLQSQTTSSKSTTSTNVNKHVDPANINDLYRTTTEPKSLPGMKSDFTFDNVIKSSVKASSGSRNSSSGSTNSLTSEKLLFNWDVTDPSQWTMTRVTQWFRSNDFNEQWTLFFKRNNICGNKFLKLLAHENFIPFEKSLPISKTSSYNRFQYLLKKTLEENVTKGHNRNGSRTTTNSRSSSESAKAPQRPPQSSSTHIRSTSESALFNHSSKSNTNNTPSKIPEANDTTLPLRHMKTNSASALYRRSLISLRNASTTREDVPANDIKITIPSRPFSDIESVNKSPASPISPSSSYGYTGIFRRQHKSSSSEPSLFNTIFGSNTGEIPKDEKQPENNNKRVAPNVGGHPSPLKQSPLLNDDKANIWDKLKRKGPSYGENLPQTNAKAIVGMIKETPLVEAPKVEAPAPNISDEYYPKYISEKPGIFILLTKNNVSYIPFDVAPLIDKGISELKDALANSLEINNTDFSIHMTDFGAEFGLALSDDLLVSLQKRSFQNTSGKFYVRETEKKLMRRPRTATVNSQVSATLSSRSKSSVKSNVSSISNDDGNSSDVTSLDDRSSAPRRGYPRTPSHYYDNPSTSEGDYWSVKEIIPEPTPLNIPKIRSSSKNNNASTNAYMDEKRTFRIIRKESDTDIDFNKKRESPYIRVAELAPKRNAPKPPNIGMQLSLYSLPAINTSLASGSGMNSSPKPERKSKSMQQNSKPRPPPPIGIETSSKSSISPIFEREQDQKKGSPVQSYTPASTQVMIPQPYKGASHTLKLRKSSADITITPHISLKKFSRSNSSMNKQLISSSPRTLNRANSRRIVSSSTAADIFDENEISFADAPALSDSDQDYSTSSDEIIWSRNHRTMTNEIPEFSFNTDDTVELVETSQDRNPTDGLETMDNSKKMALRPSPEVVYQNLEKFFPDANLDNPIVEGMTPPTSPNPENAPSSPNVFESKSSTNSKIDPPGKPSFLTKRAESSEYLSPATSLKPPRRTKTIRIIAHEASEARKNNESSKLKRKNTKMWGTRVVEITDKKMISINKSRNSRGEYKEFAWIKGEIIGKGSFGAVYLGLNVTTGEMIAVKQVTVPEFSSQDESVISTVEALKSEVSTLKDLDHLNIVQYLGFEEKNTIYSLFLEYVAGGSVGSLIRMYGRFDDQLIRHLTVQVLKGLAYLHSKGILHRDMKADNLLLDNDGVCKISDFGISKKSNNIYSNSDMTMRGTVFWMAPEMVDTAHGYSAKVDIWSLGCVVLEMFAGKRPWSNLEVVAAMFQIGKSKTAPPIPEDTRPLISPAGLDFLDSCFEIDPEKRPTADTLVSHEFCKTSPTFDFSSTSLALFIRSNDKLNSSKLRISSQEI